ncbi:MAG: SusC/RagA family TonB-linked outer membrane protein [Saprospiraceae bacterium]|nr:SusC/RagA family TonB-linked outer membrane protein [Saprospiraceae bacterium]
MKKLSLVLALVLFGLGSMLAQRTVSGTVSDQSGEALIGASVLVKGTTTGTVTDIDGSYRVTVPTGSNTLVVSYTGFNTQEVAIGASNVLDITMEEGVTLETAVVTALGIQRDEKSLGYAVESVSSEELTGANENNLVSALAGKVAGLNVTSSTGTAGASASFLIRGASTISGSNQPLIVVDGVPIDNQQLRSGGGGAVASVAFSNRAIDLNQSEIESVTVLKGAAATALYGSLAGNGAIIITTKQAKAGQKISVDFSTSFTISEVNKLPELQSEYAQGYGGVYYGAETGLPFSYGPSFDTLRYANDAGDYIWDPNGSIVGQSDPNATSNAVVPFNQFDFFRKGFAQNYNFGISAATDKSSIRFSGGFLKDQGIVPNNVWNRLNLGVNANTKLGDKINLGVGFQYVNSGGTRIEQGSNTSGVMLGLLRTAPSFDNTGGFDDPVNEEGAYTLPSGGQRNYRGGGGYDNPYWTVNNNPLNDEVNRIITNLNFSWDIAPWVNLSWRPGFDYYTDFRKQYFAIGSRTLSAGQVFEDQYEVGRFNSDLLLTFNRDINEWLDANLTLGHNVRQSRTDELYVQGDGLVIPGFYDISNVSSVSTFANNTLGRNQGFYGMLELGMWDNFYLTGTYRIESDLSLPEANNTFPYYSISGSWVWSELLEANNVLSFGKLRASIGKVGLGTFPYSTLTYYGSPNHADGWTNGLFFPNDAHGAVFSLGTQRGAPDLRPEVQTSWELGLDLRFLQNRVGLDLTYYDGTSTDIILAVPVAGSSGYTSIVANSASISNTGFEALLDVTPVSTPSFEWNFGVNFSRNRNEVLELAEGVENVSLGGFVGASTRAVVGVPYGTIFGFGFYKDADGNTVIGSDGFPVLDPNEKAFDSALPDWTMGIRNTFSFKGLSLSALLDIKQGGSIWNGTRSALYYFGTHQETADLRNTTQVFEGTLATYDSEGVIITEDHDNDETTPEIPVVNGTNTQEVFIDEDWLANGNANGFVGDNTGDFIEDASWIRLRDVSLSYSLPQAMLSGTPLSAISLSVSARNLWLSTDYKGVDPETNLYGASNAQGLDYFNMPNTKSYTIGLQVKF